MRQGKLSVEQYHDYLYRKLREIIDHHYRNSPATKQRMDACGIAPSDIKTLDDLEKLPLLAKDEMVRLQAENPPFAGFLGQPLEEQQKVYISPGPLYDTCDHEQVLEAFAESMEPLKVGKGDKIINTFSYHMVPLAHWLDDAARRRGATIIPTGTGSSELQVKLMHDLGVTGYLGTGRFLDTLIKKAEELGYDFRRDFRLRFWYGGADPTSEATKRKFTEDYGIERIEIYGTAELAIVAYECQYHNGWHVVKHMIAEILDPVTRKRLGPGEIGEVVCTAFDKSYALIRFCTGDLSRYQDTPCPCGDVAPRLMGFLGRVGEAIKVRGMFVHPENVREALAKFPQLTKCQLVINQVGGKDVVLLKVEGTYEESISQEIYKRFPEVCRVRLDNVEFLSPGTIPADAKVVLDQRTWE